MIPMLESVNSTACISNDGVPIVFALRIENLVALDSVGYIQIDQNLVLQYEI